MKKLFPVILIFGLIYLVNISGFTQKKISKSKTPSLKSAGTADITLKSLFATGEIPIKIGMPDVIEVNVINNETFYVKLRIRKKVVLFPFSARKAVVNIKRRHHFPPREQEPFVGKDLQHCMRAR